MLSPSADDADGGDSCPVANGDRARSVDTMAARHRGPVMITPSVSHTDGDRWGVCRILVPERGRLFLPASQNPGCTCSLMPDEVKNKRDSTACNNCGREQVSEQRDAQEKYDHRAGGEYHSTDISVNRYLSCVNFRVGKF